MANPFSKAWRYLMALFSSKVDEYADPKVQIQQAIEEAQRQHQALTQQAGQVIGNQRQLEMRLNRQLADIENLQVNVRQALTLADQATAAGDAAKATEYTNAAEAFAAQLVTSEQSVEDLKTLHDQALQAAGQAKKAVEQNAMMLQQKIAERTKLLSQLEQTTSPTPRLGDRRRTQHRVRVAAALVSVVRDRERTRLNSSHTDISRMPSSACK